MRILGMGVPEFIVILGIIILLFVIFGPKNLPKLGTAVGKTVKNLKAGLRSAKKHAADDKPVVAEIEAAEVPADEAVDQAAPATVVADVVEDAPAAAEAVAEQVERVPETAADRAEAAFAKVESAVAKAEAAASQADAEAVAQDAPRTVRRVVKRIN